LQGVNTTTTINTGGDKNANILIGTTKDEIFVAGAGNDILTGNGGMDVLACNINNFNVLDASVTDLSQI
jgi:Ca2+-binding RTX toxin-like protein